MGKCQANPARRKGRNLSPASRPQEGLRGLAALLAPRGDRPSPGGPQGAPQAPPQPQAYQTPPDLGQMFVTLMQRQQSSEQFNRGLGMLAAGFAQPRDRETMINAMQGQSGDPGASS